MTEDEFIARLTYHNVTANDLYSNFDDNYVMYHRQDDEYYYSILDLYVTDCNILVPKGTEFRFIQSDVSKLDSIVIKLRHDS